jgi:hypothetical protein
MDVARPFLYIHLLEKELYILINTDNGKMSNRIALLRAAFLGWKPISSYKKSMMYSRLSIIRGNGGEN